MEKETQPFNETCFYIAIAGIFMLIICHSWLSDGMFMDGTIYAVLSRNMTNGSGTFWHPHFTDTLFPVFVEHPPLAFGLEAILFRVFGDNRFVERFYSLLTILITAMLIVSIWKLILKKSSTGWLPLLFWITMPTVNWISVNHMLENTLAIFICLSVLFYLKSLHSNRMLFLFLSGSMMSLGFLTKGFVTFTPLSFPFFVWLFLKKNKFSSMVSDSLILLLSAFIPLILLYLLTGAREFLPAYIDMAFFKISKGETADSRFYILYRLIMELLPAFGIMLIFLIIQRLNKSTFNNISSTLRLSLAFFSLGLAGVLPILATMDQSTYFLYLSLPFFAISFGLLFNNSVEKLVGRIDTKSKGYKLFRLSGVIMLVTGFVLSVIFSKDINRDKNMLKDMRVIMTQLDKNTTINILPEMEQNWSLYTYYARYKNISLEPDLTKRHDYLLITTSLYSDTINNGFERIDLETKEYELFRRKIPDNTK